MSGGSLAPRSSRGSTDQVNSYFSGGNPPFAAIGVTGTYSLSTVGGFKYLTFTAGGTMNVTSGGTAEVLVVAGGAAGGSGGAGGGGGGGGNCFGTLFHGGAGRSGVVVIRFPA